MFFNLFPNLQPFTNSKYFIFIRYLRLSLLNVVIILNLISMFCSMEEKYKSYNMP